MTIQAIIKQATKRLELEGKLLTPDFYAEAFCKEAQRAGFTTPDCSGVEKLLATLNKEYQNELKSYPIKNITELARFVISKLNRTNPTQCMNMLESQIALSKSITQAVELLHNKEASELAKKSFGVMSKESSNIELEQIRHLWINFITNYDDTFLKSINPQADTTNLKQFLENITPLEKQNSSSVDLHKLALILTSSFIPSISASLDEKITNITEQLKQNPSLLEDKDIDRLVNDAIESRIKLDKDSIKELIEPIDSVLNKLSTKLVEMIATSDNSTIEIQKIKEELDLYKESNNLATMHKKLYTLTVALEQNTQALSKNLQDHSSEVDHLSKKVAKLENELKQAKEESREDFLTKIYNKRALEEFLSIKEAEFDRYGTDYAIIFFDLDYFKKINDTFGHDAGDAVLVAFAKILKASIREVDSVGRYGGEEFLAIIHSSSIEDTLLVANKISQRVKKSRFMYKDSRIEVSVSAGVALRSTQSSLESTIKHADDNLYRAKREGRDRVVW